MTTLRQELALEKMVENGGNVSQAMRDVGYSPNTAKTPQKLTTSKGYKEILTECGLTESFIIRNLVSDIENKPEKRLGELSLASDILGMRRAGLIIASQMNIKGDEEIHESEEQKERIRELADEINEYMRTK